VPCSRRLNPEKRTTFCVHAYPFPVLFFLWLRRIKVKWPLSVSMSAPLPLFIRLPIPGAASSFSTPNRCQHRLSYVRCTAGRVLRPLLPPLPIRAPPLIAGFTCFNPLKALESLRRFAPAGRVFGLTMVNGYFCGCPLRLTRR